jgi:hypothetical protein
MGAAPPATGWLTVPSAAATPRNVITGPAAAAPVPPPDKSAMSAERSAAVTRPSPLASAPEQLVTSPPPISSTAAPSPSVSSAWTRSKSSAVTTPSQSASPAREDVAATAVSAIKQKTTTQRVSQRATCPPISTREGPVPAPSGRVLCRGRSTRSTRQNRVIARGDDFVPTLIPCGKYRRAHVMPARRASLILRPLERLKVRMESLQRETEELLDDSSPRSKTQPVGRLRHSQIPADGETPAAGRPAGTSRSEWLLNGFEQELAKRLRVLLQRLDVPSREEIESLSKRLAELEKAVRGLAARPTRQPRPEQRKRRQRAKP